jgi:uncharacterized protein YkuJ
MTIIRRRIESAQTAGGLVRSLKLGDSISFNDGEIIVTYNFQKGRDTIGVQIKADREKYSIDHIKGIKREVKIVRRACMVK